MQRADSGANRRRRLRLGGHQVPAARRRGGRKGAGQAVGRAGGAQDRRRREASLRSLRRPQETNIAQLAQAKDQAEGYRAGAADKLGEIRKETGAKLSGAVDKFDRSVEEGAAKSKSWISGWFGGK